MTGFRLCMWDRNPAEEMSLPRVTSGHKMTLCPMAGDSNCAHMAVVASPLERQPCPSVIKQSPVGATGRPCGDPVSHKHQLGASDFGNREGGFASCHPIWTEHILLRHGPFFLPLLLLTSWVLLNAASYSPLLSLCILTRLCRSGQRKRRHVAADAFSHMFLSSLFFEHFLIPWHRMFSARLAFPLPQNWLFSFQCSGV